MNRLFVTGIGTGVGKTVVSAMLASGLGADYWKPVQCGNLDSSDSLAVRALLPEEEHTVHPESYKFEAALSPHAAAALEGRTVDLQEIRSPQSNRPLVIEGAGGLMVPLNDTSLIIDLIAELQAPVVLVSRHYLGSINHTLLSWEALERRRIQVLGVVFNGAANEATEQAIRMHAELPVIGRINELQTIDRAAVAAHGAHLAQALRFLARARNR